jgi:AcrR family transcriptional regulator
MAKGPDTRARIIDDAIKLASLEGLAGLTIGRLAERTQMSKSGLFAHFKSKEEVEFAVLAEAVARFRDAVFLRALQTPRGEPRIRALIERWLEWAQDSPGQPGGCIITQAMVELDDRPGRARDLLVESQQQWLDALSRAARVAIEEGHFRQDLDTTLFAFQLEGILLVTHQAQRLLRAADAAQRMRQAVDQLIASARVPPPASAPTAPTRPPKARSGRR